MSEMRDPGAGAGVEKGALVFRTSVHQPHAASRDLAAQGHRGLPVCGRPAGRGAAEDGDAGDVMTLGSRGRGGRG